MSKHSYRIDVEKAFSEVVRSTGGVVLADILPASPDFNNADYQFPAQKVVAELKCLTEDNVPSPAMNARVGELWRRWKREGKVQEDSVADAVWRNIPKKLQTELYHVLSKPIRKRIQKANLQIRQTKNRLNLHDHRGVLLLVNDGKLSFSPVATIHATQLALKSDFREIRDFIFFTVNELSFTTETPQPSLFWVYFHMDDRRPEMERWANSLGEAWVKHQCSILGVTGIVSEMGDMEAFWKARYLREMLAGPR